jgi:hypothetical protein
VNQRPPERDELDLLLDPLLRHAQKELRELDALNPVAAVLAGDARTVEVFEADEAVGTGDDDAKAERLMDRIRVRVEAGNVTAWGITYDGEIDGLYNEITRAVTTELEHRGGDSVFVYLNYRHSGPNGAVRFGRLMARPRARELFDPQDPSTVDSSRPA